MSNYIDIPILEVARRCMISFNSKTLHKTEVEAYCPFCNDRNGHWHLYLNTAKNRWYCQHCSQKGNSVTLYSKIFGVDNKQAFNELTQNKLLRFTTPAQPMATTLEIAPLDVRHAVYYDLLELLPLENYHKENLLKRGLDERRINENAYRSISSDWRSRQAIAKRLSKTHNLAGVPGFYFKHNSWQLCGNDGFLIPILSIDGLIQGLQIRLDDTSKGKYRWLSSNPEYLDSNGKPLFPKGSKAASFVHVTGDISRDTICVTEGALKGDIASFLRINAPFICTAGSHVNSYLIDCLKELSPKKVLLCYDMDHLHNNQVSQSIAEMKRLITEELLLNCEVFYWNANHKGIDDFLLYRKGLKAA